MKNNRGYFLLEYIISFSLLIIISSIIIDTLYISRKYNINLEDSVELYQQSIEITNSIDKLISNSSGIINIDNNNSSFRIKLKYIGELNQEIIFRKNLNKIFFNTLNLDGSSKPGGYEIGCYIDDIYIKVSECGQIVDISLKLSKNKSIYETSFSTYIKNSSGEV